MSELFKVERTGKPSKGQPTERFTAKRAIQRGRVDLEQVSPSSHRKLGHRPSYLFQIYGSIHPEQIVYVKSAAFLVGLLLILAAIQRRNL